MEYKVYPFILNTLVEKQTIIQNVKGIVILKNRQMVDLFDYLDVNNIDVISDEIISHFFYENSDEAIQFMLKHNLIYRERKIKINFKKVNFYTNCRKIKECLNLNLSGYPAVTGTVNDFDLDVLEFDYEQMIGNLNVFILNPFNYKKFVYLVNKLKDKDVMFQIVFYYNRGFYFSNYFKKEWNTPCPICFFSKIESELRAEAMAGIDSFQTVMDLIYYRKEYFENKIELENHMIVPMIYMIIKQIRSGDEQLIKFVNYININTYSVKTDIATYWELCECNE